jgi:hypothetical protein
MKTHGGAEVQLHAFLISTLHKSEWPASRPDLFTSEEIRPDTHGEKLEWSPEPVWMLRRTIFLVAACNRNRLFGRQARRVVGIRLSYHGSNINKNALDVFLSSVKLWRVWM